MSTLTNLGYSLVTGAPAPASELPPLSDLWSSIWDQIDLNSGDSVLLYSGILQAIPLIGGALKGVSLLNRAARKLTKDLKRKPFTTVVRTLIQGDFINRFVVKPTIDDMQKFANSFNYVVNVVNTAHARNVELATAFSAEASNVISETVRDRRINHLFARVLGKEVSRVTASRKLFMLAKVTYDQCAIDPIKLWAKRVGLTKPLDSAWDLVPFSFVLDYFTRAGDFISGAGDIIADQEGLVGKVASVYDVWEVSSRKREIQFTPEEIRPISSYWSITASSNQPITTSVGVFDRHRTEIMNDTNFWDNGFVNVQLSTIRARTLAELFVQPRLR